MVSRLIGNGCICSPAVRGCRINKFGKPWQFSADWLIRTFNVIGNFPQTFCRTRMLPNYSFAISRCTGIRNPLEWTGSVAAAIRRRRRITSRSILRRHRFVTDSDAAAHVPSECPFVGCCDDRPACKGGRRRCHVPVGPE